MIELSGAQMPDVLLNEGVAIDQPTSGNRLNSFLTFKCCGRQAHTPDWEILIWPPAFP